jgi:hypothetical protein
MHRIQARRIPELRFVHDRSIAHSVHIAEVLDGLRREREGADAAGAHDTAAAGAPDDAAEPGAGGERP